ncbi:uncharacterized protein BO88DRAFT_4075 [Aspergillus vadensis CBS 113365]|uniref:Uncharacterized protein n=1 Tax=Aspergillus vadensis (strain CBS 113365 / IMI 142717 / IBT 24658) TaxID=1448311 RepID=A0A319BP46_ASPVC|nr:hypothetical protein BO88DRAFT_4075 [Aspergillus vadensis CBS 113365]PYH74161.1 hypothetical protein BO88DRAFT_4075 [Aspergillus vadensis CBS 113365]
MCLLTPLERRLFSTPDRSMYKVQDISGPKHLTCAGPCQGPPECLRPPAAGEPLPEPMFVSCRHVSI